jgi:BTB/POZ domain
MSSKLRAAFKETDNEQFVGKDFIYRIHMTESDVSIIEIVLQFMYTGNIVLPHGVQLDITRVLSCGQKLGLDANRLAGCLGAMLGLMDSRYVKVHTCL